jgi:CRISPR-associated protein Cmr4
MNTAVYGYQKAHGIIETLSPLHVGATAGEESGNLNLIFRDQFTQTGTIPGSSIRGRFRAEMRHQEGQDEGIWYGKEAVSNESESTTESIVKFEYASIVWIPVFCPGQPIVWVSSPRLLKRYKRIANIQSEIPTPYTGSEALKNALDIQGTQTLFFNFGFLTVEQPNEDLKAWFPDGEERPAVVVEDTNIALIHDMALYRQSRVALHPDEKRVRGKAFFNTEALPEGTIMVFPIAIKPDKEGRKWEPFQGSREVEIYLGGLESIGFGHAQVTLKNI